MPIQRPTRDARIREQASEMLDILRTLSARLPDLNDPDTPVSGFEAVEALGSVWPRLQAVLAHIAEGA